jgi:ADP-ribose pyrophosphatase YjhB (NUDIX family)
MTSPELPKSSETREEIFARGKMFELVHATQPDGRVFEIARRAPGVRLIIANKEKGELLLTKEFRRELQNWDYRLPGGKVFDSLDEFENFRATGEDISMAARKKATEESVEEAGIQINELEEFKRSTLGATVEWDLFVFEAKTWQPAEDGQWLEDGEEIEADNWFTYDEVAEKILKGEMQEERIALILLQWIHQQKKEANDEI